MKRKLIFCTLILTTLLLGGCTRKAVQEPSNTSPNFATDFMPGSEKISEEDAKQIALTHAGLTADQVTFIKSNIDRDDGQENYDVEFYTRDQKEYDYEINSYTGEVLEYDHDVKNRY